MVSIREVAKKSGYSVTTVSRVINNYQHVSDDARRKILNTIRELNYSPNEVARKLAFGKSYNIGVVITDVNHPYFFEILKGMLVESTFSNYKIVVLCSQCEKKLEIDYLNQLKSKAFDALIFLSRTISLCTIANYSKYCSIVCCENARNYNIPYVCVSENKGITDAFKWMKKKKVLRIAFLCSHTYNNSMITRSIIEAYIPFFKRQSFPKYVYSNILTFDDGYRIAKELAASNPRIDCIVANSEAVAGVLKYYTDKGYLLPLIIGHGNGIIGNLLNVPILEYDLEKIGELTFKMAINSINEKNISVPLNFILN